MLTLWTDWLTHLVFSSGSARSAHSNAYFYGFLKAKRIVLYDTLIKGYSLNKAKEDVSCFSLWANVRRSSISFQEEKKNQAKTEQEEPEKLSEEEESPTHCDTTPTEEKTEESQDTKKKADKGCEPDEVLAVLCHEFGHWYLSHNLINLCISFVSLMESERDKSWPTIFLWSSISSWSSRSLLLFSNVEFSIKRSVLPWDNPFWWV